MTSESTVLLRDGQALPRQRISEPSLPQAVRSAGLGGLELVGAVVLEPNGTLSVVPESSRGSGSVLLVGAQADR